MPLLLIAPTTTKDPYMDRVKRVKLIEISSVDPSAPTILRPRVRIPSTNLCLTFFNLNFNCNVKKDENKHKDAGIGPFFKKTNRNETYS